MNQANALPENSEKILNLAQTLDELLRHKKSGAALPECYGDQMGAEHWAKFVRQSDPAVQYTFQSEVSTIEQNGAAIASLLSRDEDLDKERLVVLEKGGGSAEALRAKSFRLMDCFQKAAMNVGLYVNLERSQDYRAESLSVAGKKWPQAQAMAIDIDFNNEEPDLNMARGPRIVMELGSSRSNIPTSHNDSRSFSEQTYAELQRRFAHDRKLCGDGGVLIVGSDANQTESARAAYAHPAHSAFSENLVHRGVREGALSQNFNPNLLKYDPIWSEKDHVIRHTLVANANQKFGILNSSGRYEPATIRKGDHFVLSHSIKWPVQKMIAAAESQGFKCMGVFWGEDRRVPVYFFKAVGGRKNALRIVG